MTAITPEQFEFINDWEPAADSTRNLIRTAGWREVDELSNPPDGSTQIVEIAGTITNAAGGVVEFPWSALDADQAPGGYYYDIEMTDALSRVQTLTIGRYTFVQDISK
ncbi:MAG: hypothetical protein AB7U75_14260 [Hyphomicrobiaceae bacterium]